jgi:hypothetical protein
MRAWRDHYHGGLSAVLTPMPKQTRVNVFVDGRAMQFRASHHLTGGVMILVTATGGNTIVFYDTNLNNGQGGFLPACGSLSPADVAQLGRRRGVRNRFLQDLVTAARQPQPTAV